MNAWTCAAVMSVADVGACALAEEATSNTNIPTIMAAIILRMRRLLSLSCLYLDVRNGAGTMREDSTFRDTGVREPYCEMSVLGDGSYRCSRSTFRGKVS